MREWELIGQLQRSGTVPVDTVSIGDDCCVWQPDDRTALSVDTVVEGRHFERDTPEALVGRKAAASALSDLAAMGATPIGAVVALCCPAHRDAAALMLALRAELERHDCMLLGGDTTAADQLIVSVTVCEPAAERLLLRQGAELGDVLAVTGLLGGSFADGRHLKPQPRLAEGAWLAAQSGVKAMLDLSDGLAGDVRRLAEASDVGMVLHTNQIPLHPTIANGPEPHRRAASDGEDYELLVCRGCTQMA